MRCALCLLALLLLAGCAFGPPKELRLSPTSFDALPAWKEDDHAEALAAFRRSCGAIAQLSPESIIGEGKLRAPASVWQNVCGQLPGIDTEAKAFFETHFTPFAAEGDGLFTGYYEPLLHGSRKRSERYHTPVYRLPWDVQPGVPYFSRADINRGALRHRKLELLWVDDPVMLFFAEVQGSALVKFKSGKTVRIGYAGKNNQSYVAIGKLLKQSGELADVNFFNLREWLYAHPERAKCLMEQNPSYVFFRELPASDGPIGAEGIGLLPERSLAVDKHFIPLGLPLYVQTVLPDGALFHRLMVAQDIGGAIKGPVRGDIFFGRGPGAEQKAGMMQARGGYVLLVPNAMAGKL